MPAYKVGRLWKFKLSEADEWIRFGGAADDKAEMPTKPVLSDSELDMIIVARYSAKGNEEIWTIKCIIK